jgi:hypothetical protein
VEDPPLPDDVALFLHTSGTTSRPKVRRCCCAPLSFLRGAAAGIDRAAPGTLCGRCRRFPRPPPAAGD